MKFTVKVLMFGRSGVGKTSLLAAMYNSLQTWPTFENLVVKSVNHHDLDASLDGLKRFIRTLKEKEGELEALPATANKKTFTITIELHNCKHSLDLIFIDMPGEWLNYSNRECEWVDLIKSSDIIINAISAPAMMEEDREYNEDINKPSKFIEILNQALEPAARSCPTKRIYLVPVKCERYMNTLNGKDQLLSVMKGVYNNHLVKIRDKSHACYGLAVNTLGSVVFDRFELLNGGQLRDCYKLESLDSTAWNPKNHDVLAAHILDHCFATLIDNIGDEPNELKVTISNIRKKISGLFKDINKYEVPDKIIFRGPECFAGDTPVLLPDGHEIPIAMLKAGMEVLTMTRSKIFEPQRILKVSRHENVPLMAITIGECTLRVTAKHLFMVDNKWKKAELLTVGDKITSTPKDAFHPVTVTVSRISSEKMYEDAYNIYVKKNSNFIAGGALVSSFVKFNKSRQWLEYLIDRVLRK